MKCTGTLNNSCRWSQEGLIGVFTYNIGRKGHRLKYYISLSELKANHSMSIQVTTFVLCHIILPNLFVVTCMSHCEECQ